MSEINKKLLLEVADAIEANPEYFDMDDYLDSCNTTACIGGWALFLHSKRKRLKLFAKKHGRTPQNAIAKVIGIEFTSPEWEELCHVRGWLREDLAQSYRRAKTPKTKAKIAAQYVRWFVENN